MKSIGLTVCVLLLCACTTVTDEASNGEPAATAPVYYGTDRARRNPDDPERFYGPDRGDPEYGIARVENTSSPAKFRLAAVEPRARDDFLDTIHDAVGQADTPALLVFIHGYNRSFLQFSTLVGEWVANTGFDGVPVIWSWPSSQNPAAYARDETNLRWSQPHLAGFIKDLLEHSGAQTIHLIGHSLGARLLADVALEDLDDGNVDYGRIGEFVLLAPDIDSDIFERDLAPSLVAKGLDTTLYTSANDAAMASARTLRGGYPRAGDSSNGPVLIDGMETVDVTEANLSILGHSYFEESPLVMQDLAILLNERKPASERPNLIEVYTPRGPYWRLNRE